MIRAYYDANHLFKLQCVENGTAEVRAHAATVNILCIAAHGRAEFASAAFRKVREGTATPADYQLAISQVQTDTATGNLQFLPLTDAILDRVETAFATAPATTYLRAADAIHLATAAEHGFTKIHSNDKHLLASASLFGLVGVNVIPQVLLH
jgi:predicted nucleic acid-binding protein